ncbi:MAG: GNAT family N-acetyltransferase [Lapillicoccus sp.]
MSTSPPPSALPHAGVRLVRPEAERQGELLAMMDEFATDRIDGGAMGSETVERLRDPEVFQHWVDMLVRYEEGVGVPHDLVPSTSRWVEEDGRLVGFISLRHELNAFLLEKGGHIGYAVRPADRGRGLATAATALMLQECGRRGIDPVLITCDEDNGASAGVIERNGGVLEDVRDGKRRYWVRLGA